jgi:glycerophosphoryl diester phosphodiesterase
VVTVRQPRHPTVIGHRGEPVRAPEETLPSFQAAVDDGAAVLEFDIQWTSDGAMVALHDETLDRTTDCTGTVQSKTLAQVEACDAGSWKGARWAGTRVPTMQQIVALAKRYGKGIAPELKQSSPTTEQLTAFAGVIEAAGMESVTVVQSFEADAIRRYRDLGTGASTALTTDSHPPPVATLQSLGADYLIAPFTSLTQREVRGFQSARIKVWLYTVRTSADNEQAIHLYPNGILTNDTVLTKSLLPR